MDEVLNDSEASQVIGTCTDLCPEIERIKRVAESDVHKLEQPHDDITGVGSTLKDTMIKKFQRSSADHELQIAEMMRTPETLLKTVTYIEDHVMEKAEEGEDLRCGGVPSQLFVYLFIWDRYRMVAKDFTLQQHALPVSKVWVECHERMARWFVLMDHRMKGSEDYIGGHAQQNGEQLNNLLKTLQGCYFRPGVPTEVAENAGEFIGYFLIFQVGNSGEVAKHLQRLPRNLLDLREVQFAVDVWAAIRTENYAQFFKLLRQANLLQACLMHRYVIEMRLCAMRRICKVYATPGKAAVGFKTTLPLDYFYHLLMFESEEECVEFMQHCGIDLVSADADEDDEQEEESRVMVVVDGQDVDDLLPLDKNNHPIYPTAWHMAHHIEQSKLYDTKRDVDFSVQDICRGLATKSAKIAASGKGDALPCTWQQPTRSITSASTFAVLPQHLPIDSMEKSFNLPSSPKAVLSPQPEDIASAKKKVSIPSFLKKKSAPLLPSSKVSANLDVFTGDLLQVSPDPNDDRNGLLLVDKAAIRRVQLSTVGPLQSQRGGPRIANEEILSTSDAPLIAPSKLGEMTAGTSSTSFSKQSFAAELSAAQAPFDHISFAPKDNSRAPPPSFLSQTHFVDKLLASGSGLSNALVSDLHTTEQLPSLLSPPSTNGFELPPSQKISEDLVHNKREEKHEWSNQTQYLELHPVSEVELQQKVSYLPESRKAEATFTAPKPRELIDYYPDVSMIRSLFLQSLQEQLSASTHHRVVVSCFVKWRMQHLKLITKVQKFIKKRFMRLWRTALAQLKTNRERFMSAFSNSPSKPVSGNRKGPFSHVFKQRIAVGREKALSLVSSFLHDGSHHVGSGLVDDRAFMLSFALVARYIICKQLASHHGAKLPSECALSEHLERLVLDAPLSSDFDRFVALRRIYDTNPICAEFRKRYNVDEINLVWNVQLTTEASRNMILCSDECPVMNVIRAVLSNRDGFLSHFPEHQSEAEIAYLSRLYLHNSLLSGVNRLFVGHHLFDVASEPTEKSAKCLVSVMEHCPNKPIETDNTFADVGIVLPSLSSSPAAIHVLTFSEYNSHRSDLHSYCSQQLNLFRYHMEHETSIGIVVIVKSVSSHECKPHIYPSCNILPSNSFLDKIFLILDSIWGNPDWRLAVQYSLIIEAPAGRLAVTTEESARKGLMSLLLLLSAKVIAYPLLGRIGVADAVRSVFCGSITSPAYWLNDLSHTLLSNFHSLYQIKQENGLHADYSLRTSKIFLNMLDQPESSGVSSVLLLSKRESAMGLRSYSPVDALASSDYIDVMLFFLKSAYDCINANYLSPSNITELVRALDIQFVSLVGKAGISFDVVQLQKLGLAISHLLESLMSQVILRDVDVFLGVILNGLCNQCKYLFVVYFGQNWQQDHVYYTHCSQAVQLFDSAARLPIGLVRLSDDYFQRRPQLTRSAALCAGKRKYEEVSEHPGFLSTPYLANHSTEDFGVKIKKAPRSEATWVIESEKEKSASFLGHLEAEILRGFGAYKTSTITGPGNRTIPEGGLGKKEAREVASAVTSIEEALAEARAERVYHDRVACYFRKYI